MLTVDQGNSRCKLRLWHATCSRGPELLGALDVALEEDLGPRLDAWLDALPRPEVAAVSSVAPPADEARLVDALATRVEHVRAQPASGLAVRCRVPEEVGRDRLFAARGALAVCGASCIVVDAGTALTVDAVEASGDGVFLGGAIAPGPRLLARSLAGGTARLVPPEPLAGAPALGRDTAEAIRAGVAVGFRGAAAALVEALAEEAGMPSAAVVLTGGARGFLTTPRPFTERSLVELPDAVHLGLLHACRWVR